MDLQLHRYIPRLGFHRSKDNKPPPNTFLETPNEKKPNSNTKKLWEWSLHSIIPWAIRARDKLHFPATTLNKELIKKSNTHQTIVDSTTQQYTTTIRFRPYVSKVPWHKGPRGFLCQLFPRYGHYCGPNWSSGRDNGSPIWDQRPIDWLDFCCYCHDMGYDTYDQAELLKADVAFLECLERPNMSIKGDPRVANLYKTMCISGLRNVLIPYRQNLVKLQSGKFGLALPFPCPLECLWDVQRVELSKVMSAICWWKN